MALPPQVEAKIGDVPQGCWAFATDMEHVGGAVYRITVTADGEEIAQWTQNVTLGAGQSLSDWLVVMEDEFIEAVRDRGNVRPPKPRGGQGRGG